MFDIFLYHIAMLERYIHISSMYRYLDKCYVLDLPEGFFSSQMATSLCCGGGTGGNTHFFPEQIYEAKGDKTLLKWRNNGWWLTFAGVGNLRAGPSLVPLTGDRKDRVERLIRSLKLLAEGFALVAAIWWLDIFFCVFELSKHYFL